MQRPAIGVHGGDSYFLCIPLSWTGSALIIGNAIITVRLFATAYFVAINSCLSPLARRSQFSLRTEERTFENQTDTKRFTFRETDHRR